MILSILFTFTAYAADYVGFDCTYSGSGKVTLSNYETIGATARTPEKIKSTLGEPTLSVKTWYDGSDNRYDEYEWESYGIIPWIRVTFKNGSYFSKSQCMLQLIWADL